MLSGSVEVWKYKIGSENGKVSGEDKALRQTWSTE